MAKYIVRRLLQLIPVMLVLSFITYALLYLAPGDPAEMRLKAGGITPTDEMLEKVREDMGLNEPFLQRYFHWLGGALRGDLGNSYKDGAPVAGKMQRATKYTLILTGTSVVLSLLIALPLGVLSALLHRKLPDHLIRLAAFIGCAVPTFLASLLLIYFFCIRMKLLPVISKGTAKGLILPSAALAVSMAGEFIRQIRTETLDQLQQSYVIGARVRGDRESVILIKNVLRNASLSLITILGLSFATLLGGSIVTEMIFMWPGLGKLVMDAISNRDYPIVQGFVLWMSMIYVIVNLITDISYRLVDPRIREGSR